MGMCNEKYEEMLANVNLKIKKRVTVTRMTICTKNKPEVKLYCPPNSNRLRSVQHLFLKPSHEISCTTPKLLLALLQVLNSMMEVMFSKLYSMLLLTYKFSAT